MDQFPPTNKQFFVILLIASLLFGAWVAVQRVGFWNIIEVMLLYLTPAVAEGVETNPELPPKVSNPLEGYAVIGVGYCGLKTEKGTIMARCIALRKNGGDEIYFAIFGEADEPVAIFKREKDKPDTLIWQK